MLCDPVQSPLAGFNFVTDLYQYLLYVERMHHSDKGISEYLNNIAVKQMPDRALDAMSDLLRECAPFLGFRLPSCGVRIDEIRVTATEVGNIFKCLPVLLLAVHEVDPAPSLMLACVGAPLEVADAVHGGVTCHDVPVHEVLRSPPFPACEP